MAGQHRYYACLELGIRETKYAFAGDFSGLVFFMARYGFFQPAAEIAEYILVVHMGVRYYVEKGQTFAFVLPKVRTLSIGIFFTPTEWTTKKAKRDQHSE